MGALLIKDRGLLGVCGCPAELSLLSRSLLSLWSRLSVDDWDCSGVFQKPVCPETRAASREKKRQQLLRNSFQCEIKDH